MHLLAYPTYPTSPASGHVLHLNNGMDVCHRTVICSLVLLTCYSLRREAELAVCEYFLSVYIYSDQLHASDLLLPPPSCHPLALPSLNPLHLTTRDLQFAIVFFKMFLRHLLLLPFILSHTLILAGGPPSPSCPRATSSPPPKSSSRPSKT
ncbi:hypothetical protein BO70DRAFT_122059 [Aspergillus heteromorphus CBS 117.55]|uniref:Uncharacterized protein n=1 Tax=Aspergillus heteromorphus CBS 117.55 TaxID=1448321 RepID=A0A317VFQ4_9EURO|nr:uncharacterized protein BO70DRAFT_122059 [Aspergillus heteromorphus CBS 117.55]PWY71732.1 hypothetical protein BO70DRAFT_122059 [Aspergillus heteromorphus CBS 117.55]